MKSEKQKVVRYKQPIKINKPLQRLFALVKKKNIRYGFVVIFFSFHFLNALQSDINSNRVYVLGHKYVLGLSQTHFSMSLSRAQNRFMPKNINSIVIIMITSWQPLVFILSPRFLSISATALHIFSLRFEMLIITHRFNWALLHLLRFKRRDTRQNVCSFTFAFVSYNTGLIFAQFF